MKSYGKPPSGRFGLRADKIGRLQAELREVEDRIRTTGNPAQLPNFRVRRQTIIDELRALGEDVRSASRVPSKSAIRHNSRLV